MGCIKSLYQGASQIRGPLLAPSRLDVNVAALSCPKDLTLRLARNERGDMNVRILLGFVKTWKNFP